MMLDRIEELLANAPKRKNYASKEAYRKAKAEHEKLHREYLFWAAPEEYREHCILHRTAYNQKEKFLD